MHGIFRRRHLPHWDVPGATYFVTACLEGSIPAQGLRDLDEFEGTLNQRPKPEGMSERDWIVHCWKLMFTRAETWLDRAPAVRHLADPELARIIVDSMYFFAGQRYDLLAFVVMPSHFHWVFRPIEAWVASLGTAEKRRTARERIMHSVKRYTAGQCNERLGLPGSCWQQESYDHWAREADELARIRHYVE